VTVPPSWTVQGFAPAVAGVLGVTGELILLFVVYEGAPAAGF
jgi:hypothetical protein